MSTSDKAVNLGRLSMIDLNQTQIRFLEKLLLDFKYGPDVQPLTFKGTTNTVANERLTQEVLDKLPVNRTPLAPPRSRRQRPAKPLTNDC
jgi:hypothetical protein